MSLYEAPVHRSSLRMNARIRQPSEDRERRRPKMPRDTITLPDGSAITERQFHLFRSDAHKALPRHTFEMSSEKLRTHLPASEWRVIDRWLRQNPFHGERVRGENILVTVLIMNAARVFNDGKNPAEQRTALRIFHDILAAGTAVGTLL